MDGYLFYSLSFSIRQVGDVVALCPLSSGEEIPKASARLGHCGSIALVLLMDGWMDGYASAAVGRPMLWTLSGHASHPSMNPYMDRRVPLSPSHIPNGAV